ncbi:MAG: hypothetical protein A2285_09690 [Elusimicrobia bacterium RIFOXYA12_FULL_57_11]|nr:MAG: hypothetical protein A2285_09690 [Elusimicrobia bacterium RIFOXYA12_FULL_57_11]
MALLNRLFAKIIPMRAVNKNNLLFFLLLSCACAHKASMSALSGLPGSNGASAAQNNAYVQPVSTASVSGETPITEQDIRDLEEGDGSGLVVFASSAPPLAPEPVNLGGNGRLTLTRHDTGEKLTVAYRGKDGTYNKEALAKINRIMRCSADNTEIEMSVKLIELLDAVEDKFGKKGLTLLSGYRTLELNRSISGAAEHSLHMLGWAADIKIPGYSSTKVKKYAQKLGAGGVGYYPYKGFTHLDVGKSRYWVVRRAPRKRRAVRGRAAAAAKKKSSRPVKTLSQIKR